MNITIEMIEFAIEVLQGILDYADEEWANDEVDNFELYEVIKRRIKDLEKFTKK